MKFKPGGTGTVSNSGTLTSNAVVIGQGTTVISTITADSAVSGHFLASTAGAPAMRQIMTSDVAGTHSVAQGGTGITSGTANGIVIFASTGLMASTTADSATTHFFGSQNGAPAFRAIVTADTASGVFGPNFGGTGQSSYTKGDLLIATAGGLSKLPVAADGMILSTDASQTLGVKWIAAPTGGAGTPGGSNTQLQYNNNSSFGGIALVTTDGTRIAIGPNTSTLISVDVAGSIRNVPVILTDGATIAINASQSNYFQVTLGGNRTLSNPTNGIAGQKIIVMVSQDATGSRFLGLGTAYKFGTDVATYDTSKTAGMTDYLGIIFRNSVSADVVSISKGYR